MLAASHLAMGASDLRSLESKGGPCTLRQCRSHGAACITAPGQSWAVSNSPEASPSPGVAGRVTPPHTPPREGHGLGAKKGRSEPMDLSEGARPSLQGTRGPQWERCPLRK